MPPSSLVRNLVSSPDPSTEGPRAGGCDTTPLCTRSFLKTSQGPGLAHNLQTQLQARTTDEGAEAQSCTPCYRPSGWNRAPASGSCHDPPPPPQSLQYSQSPPTGRTHDPRPMLGISPHYVRSPLIPTLSCLCGNATSSRKCPPNPGRLRLLGPLPAN